MISITPAFAGEHDEILIVAARAGDRITKSGPAVETAIEVYKEARELHYARRRQGTACQA